MNKPLLGSLVAASLLVGNANAATMYERFEVMEKEMNRLQQELSKLKAEKPSALGEDEEADEEGADKDEEEAEDKEEMASEKDSDEEEEFNAQEEIEDIHESIAELNKATAGNHLKLDVDFRTSYDNVRYKMAGTTVPTYDPTTGVPNGITTVEKNRKNNALLTNRLWLNMNWAANENMSFTGQLAYNKTYGARFGDTGTYAGFETFDWFSSTNPNGDGVVRVKSAYYFYRNDTFLGTDVPWTFSLGRRPSTNGHLINFRENDLAASPSGHTINVEFDGLSSRFGLEKVTGVSGMYIKLCAGQGSTNADEKFSASPYSYDSSDALKNIHMLGFIFVPYDNGQFSIGTQFTGASNMPGQNINMDSTSPTYGLMTNLTPTGDLYTGSIYAMTNGIGNGWSSFLDDTTFFVSGAMTRTNPDEGLDQFGQQKAMLGSTEMENGYSYWAGLNMPSLFSEEGRFGLEFNHGSKYWRPITYAEDTMIGSKVAARGDAYEVYFTEPLLEDVFSLQIRYTYIDYKYSGSNGFFGNVSGTPMTMQEAVAFNQGGNVVDKAQDVRVYLRYRY